jgi:hypothetical protein
MGKIDMSNFGSWKGVVPIAPHVPKPKEIGAKNIFEQLLFLKHSKNRYSSGDICIQTFLTFSYKLACFLQ